MTTVLLVVHTLVAIGLVALILLQKSEGGALGIGGGPNSFMSGRGAANVLTRGTTWLAAAFFATSVGLAVLENIRNDETTVIQQEAVNVDDLGPILVPDEDDVIEPLTPPDESTQTDIPPATVPNDD
jgi:preprotein translocase subunit SecG